MQIQIGDYCRFQNKMFGPPYTPYYDAYCGHTFQVDHFHPEDEVDGHVWLKCVTNPDILVDGYVHTCDLVLVDNFVQQ